MVIIFQRRKTTSISLYTGAAGWGFISVIAWFSLAGITLGVATLTVVMSVMNGFRAELQENSQVERACFGLCK